MLKYSTKDICKLKNLCRQLAGELGNEAFMLAKQVKKQMTVPRRSKMINKPKA